MRGLGAFLLLLLLSAGCAGGQAESRGGPGGAALVTAARKELGVSYKFGGNSPSEGFDCSGLVHYCFARLGLEVPRSAERLFRGGLAVPKGHLKPGDLVFFDISGSGASHVGIYIGDDKMIHAPSTGGKVRVENISIRYWLQRFVGARRYD